MESEAAMVSLKQEDEIIAQPEDIEVSDGETAEFHVEIIGAAPAYQWQWSADGKSWKNCLSGGYNTDTFSFVMKDKYAGRQYKCVVTSGGKTYISEAATLGLDGSPKITGEPEDVTVSAGKTAEFHVTAKGSGLSYQWQWSADGKSWKNCTIGGYNTDTFSFVAKSSYTGRMYRCRITNGAETVYSESGLLTVTK